MPHSSAYTVELFFPLDSSNYNFISVFCPTVSIRPLDPSKRRLLWHYNSTNWVIWDNTFRISYGRDANECAECILEVEVIFSDMEAYILVYFSRSNASNSFGLITLFYCFPKQGGSLQTVFALSNYWKRRTVSMKEKRRKWWIRTKRKMSEWLEFKEAPKPSKNNNHNLAIIKKLYS